MSLSDLKKLAVRQSVDIRFRIANGLECIVTSHGISRVPSLKRPPEFDLESELAQAKEFVLAPAVIDPRGRRGRQKEQKLTRSELEQMVAGAFSGNA